MNAENLRVPENLFSRKIAILFPGQGSQEVGMGRNLFDNSLAARAVFDEANETLGFNLAKSCFEGPEDELRQTHITQPATLTVSIAALRAFEEELGTVPDIIAAAGHSVGEYAALVAAGALSFPDALRLVRKRGLLMHEASKKRQGFMAAIIGLDIVAIEDVCQQTSVQIANINSERQIVISGPEENFANASELLRTRGARIAKLPVGGAFHSLLMESAVPGMIEALNKVKIGDSMIPVISNRTALPLRTSSEIRDDLQKQIVEPVKWLASMLIMKDMGVEALIEMGHGTVLTNLAKKIDQKLKTFNVGSISDIQSLALNPSV